VRICGFRGCEKRELFKVIGLVRWGRKNWFGGWWASLLVDGNP